MPFDNVELGSKLADRLMEVREESGYTQEDLARELGEPQSFVSKCERGTRRIRVDDLLRITEVLEVDPRDILTDVASGHSGFDSP